MKNIMLSAVCILLFACGSPEIIIHTPIEGEAFVTEAYIYIHSTINDPDGIKRVTYKIYGNTFDIFPLGTPNSYDLYETQSMYNFPAGYEVEITIEAEDNLGNIGTRSVMVIHS